MDFFALVALILIVANCIAIARLCQSGSWAGSMLVGYLAFTVQVIALGYCLSAVDSFGNPRAWLLAASISTIVVSFFYYRFRHASPAPFDFDSTTKLGIETDNGSWNRTHTYLVRILASTVVLVALSNLAVVFLTAPHNYDSHTCHLARTAHFLQQGNLDWYPTNMWAQVVHPRNHPILLGFAFLIGGENFTQAVNYSAWMFLGIAVFAVVARMTGNRQSAIFSGLISLLLVNGIMVSTTTQNDLIIAVHVAIAVYFLTVYLERGNRVYLFSLALPLFVCLGIKGSALLVVPSIGVVAGYVVWKRRAIDGNSAITASLSLASALVLAVVMALPTGYAQNISRYGHPLGQPGVRNLHTLESLSTSEKIAESSKNLIRYAIDSTAVDGLKSGGVVGRLRKAAIQAFRSGASLLGIDLEDNLHSHHKFQLIRPDLQHEDSSHWGVFSLLLIWPSVIWCLAIRKNHPAGFVFSIALLVFFVAQSYAQFDPWRGRYFTSAIVFALLPVGIVIPRLLSHRWLTHFLVLAVCLGCFGAGRATLKRTNSNLISKASHPSVFVMDRLSQLFRNNPNMNEIVQKYQRLVPPAASVALALSPDCYFYPFYGRTLEHPIQYASENPTQWRKLDSQVDFLVYTRNIDKAYDSETDSRLGAIHSDQYFFLRDFTRIVDSPESVASRNTQGEEPSS